MVIKIELLLGQLPFRQVMLSYRVNAHAREAPFDLEKSRFAFVVLFCDGHPEISDTTCKGDLRQRLYQFASLVAASRPAYFSETLSNAAEWNNLRDGSVWPPTAVNAWLDQ